jgi:hypothetical protein
MKRQDKIKELKKALREYENAIVYIHMVYRLDPDLMMYRRKLSIHERIVLSDIVQQNHYVVSGKPNAESGKRLIF